MTVLHIFPNSLFLNPYLKMITKDFDYKNHVFVITDIGAKTMIDPKYYDLFEIHEVSTFKLGDVKELSSFLRNIDFDRLIIHSLYLNFLLIALVFNKKVLQKATLTLWGGSDARKFKVSKENRKYMFHAMAYEQLRKIIYRNVKTIASIIPEDYETVKKEYHSSASYCLCKYGVPTSVDLLKTDNIESEKKAFCVQVGHSGSPDGDIIEALMILEKFKDEKIQIYAPLAYGNDEYIQKVIVYGSKIFEEKFHPMTELMSGDDFSKFIMTMDAIILNTKIQQGLGNIYTYCYASKKIYLSNKGFLWNFFENEGYRFNALEKVRTSSWQEFIESNKAELENNFEKSKDFFDDCSLKDIWNNIFQGGNNYGK